MYFALWTFCFVILFFDTMPTKIYVMMSFQSPQKKKEKDN